MWAGVEESHVVDRQNDLWRQAGVEELIHRSGQVLRSHN